MSKRSKTKLPKYKLAIQDCTDVILNGTLLAIDPSTGSKSSMPGFAVFIKGELVESGTIEVDLAGNRAQKLYQINHILRTDFKAPDVVAVENISYFVGKMSPASVVSLQRAVGAIVAAWPVKCLVEVPSNAWQKHQFAGYFKSDANDSICIGLTCINIAKEFLNEQKLK